MRPTDESSTPSPGPGPAPTSDAAPAPALDLDGVAGRVAADAAAGQSRPAAGEGPGYRVGDPADPAGHRARWPGEHDPDEDEEDEEDEDEAADA